MATFAFSGRTRGGEIVSGERIGDTIDVVVAALRREQIQVTKIQPTAGRRRTSRCSPGSSR
jgi:type II secretory pathway component PulF